MEDKMCIFYLKSGKVAEVIGDNLILECDRVLVYKEQKIRASFMLDGIEGFITKEVTEDATRKDKEE